MEVAQKTQVVSGFSPGLISTTSSTKYVLGIEKCFRNRNGTEKRPAEGNGTAKCPAKGGGTGKCPAPAPLDFMPRPTGFYSKMCCHGPTTSNLLRLVVKKSFLICIAVKTRLMVKY